MLTLPEARVLLTEWALAATGGAPDAWLAGAQLLGHLDGRSWLRLDEAARSFAYSAGAPVSDAYGWLGEELAEPTGFVASITSLHVDGRIRQGATRVLGRIDARVAGTALAVRLLDHVPQVRDEAEGALLPKLDSGNAATVLGVLLAARGRQQAATALASVRRALLDRLSPAELLTTLLRTADRDVRRWAFIFGHDRGLLTPQRLLAAVHSDPDQWLRAACAEWLLTVGEPQQMRGLFTAKNVEARLLGLTRIPDDALSDEALLRLLVDRAPRVRAQARWRAHRRGIDVATWYRGQLDEPGTPAHAVASCVGGLTTAGSPEDVEAFTTLLRHTSVRVRAAAVVGVSAHAPREDALATLEPALLDPSPRVTSAAARALVRLGAPGSAAEAAWRSAQPWSVRAGWRMTRAVGGWDRVEADLRAAENADPQLSSLGLAGVRNWLETGAATTRTALSEEQRSRIQEMLVRAPVDDAVRRAVAFHARVQLPLPPAPTDEATDSPTPEGRTRRWSHLVRRR